MIFFGMNTLAIPYGFDLSDSGAIVYSLDSFMIYANPNSEIVFINVESSSGPSQRSTSDTEMQSVYGFNDTVSPMPDIITSHMRDMITSQSSFVNYVAKESDTSKKARRRRGGRVVKKILRFKRGVREVQLASWTNGSWRQISLWRSRSIFGSRFRFFCVSVENAFVLLKGFCDRSFVTICSLLCPCHVGLLVQLQKGYLKKMIEACLRPSSLSDHCKSIVSDHQSTVYYKSVGESLRNLADKFPSKKVKRKYSFVWDVDISFSSAVFWSAVVLVLRVASQTISRQ